MKKTLPFLICVVLTVASLAFAGPKEDLAAASAAGDLPRLFGLLNSATDEELRATAEFSFASALRARKLPVCAFVYFTSILKAGEKHAFYLRAVEQLIQLQAELNDQFLLANLIVQSVKDSWQRLPLAALTRANFLAGQIALRKSQLPEALAFLDTIDARHPVYLQALYLKAIALGDPRLPGGAKVPEAMAVLEKIVDSRDATQEHFANVRGLATLALGRMAYGAGRYPESVTWYTKAREFPAQRAEAIFESGFARFQNNDLPGALEAARASGAPEAVVLEATILYFGPHYPEARKALDKLSAARALPNANGRLQSVVGVVEQIDREKKLLASTAAWKASPMVGDLTTYLDQNGGVLIQVRDKVAENRASEEKRNAAFVGDQGEILRFETALAEGGNVDPAIESLKKIITRIEDGALVKAELLFHLADLHRQKALQLGDRPQEAQLVAREAVRLLDVVLREYPKYDRLAEVRAVRDALAK